MEFDNLEQFILNNKAAFDQAKAPAEAWDKINASLVATESDVDDLESFIKENRAAFDINKTPDHVWSGIENSMENEKQDSLEVFVTKNKDTFNTAQVNPRVWNEIEKVFEGDKKKQRRAFIFKISRFAAAACFLLIVGAFIGGQYFSNGNEGGANAINSQIPQYDEMNQYYQGKIDNKLTQLAGYNINDEEVNHDLKKLDDVFEELKGELLSSEHENNEALINAMLKNYETKISILEKVLEKVQSSQRSKNLKDETIKI
jgi:hypothetical protein